MRMTRTDLSGAALARTLARCARALATRTTRLPVLALPLALAACVPTMEMPVGEEHARLVEIVRQFCTAETSADPEDSGKLLAPSLRDLLARGARARGDHLTSADPRDGCAPGKVWYRGGSRMLAEVRLGAGSSDRLDFWKGSFPAIRDVRYASPRRYPGGKARSLWQALTLEQAGASATPPVPALPCGPSPYHFAFLDTDTQVFRQGATVALAPKVDQSPGGRPEVPLACTSGWTIAGPARLAADRSVFTIDADAPVGAIVAIGFDNGGKRVEAQFEVIAKDGIVLTGRWSQRGIEGCAVPELVRELEFTPGNGFAVTFNPFESYRDYWGRYSFDPATRQIRLTVADGNFVPPGLDLEGVAELSSGRLTLRGLFLGSRGAAPQRDCTYIF